MALRALFDSDFVYSFRRSRATMVAAAVTMLLIGAALLAPWIAPQNPFDPAQVDLIDAEIPPIWIEGGDPRFLLGTDIQGRDILSAILYGSRMSLAVGLCAVGFAVLLGVSLGLIAGYLGGRIDAIIMRIADVQLSFPSILIALLVHGILRSLLPASARETLAIYVLIIAIGLSDWVPFARTVRGQTLGERDREYVQAARITGRGPVAVMVSHILPNVLSPVLVIACIGVATAILTEASLSFLGVGVPATQPSLGTLIRIGQSYLFSGQWWMTVFPSLTLVCLVLSVNMVGDWLRDTLNPLLR
jgi:peptide/nickel transport system permease protein